MSALDRVSFSINIESLGEFEGKRVTGIKLTLPNMELLGKMANGKEVKKLGVIDVNAEGIQEPASSIKCKVESFKAMKLSVEFFGRVTIMEKGKNGSTLYLKMDDYTSQEIDIQLPKELKAGDKLEVNIERQSDCFVAKIIKSPKSSRSKEKEEILSAAEKLAKEFSETQELFKSIPEIGSHLDRLQEKIEISQFLADLVRTLD